MCTQVSKSTEEDWIKLTRLLGYLNGTIDMVRTISVKNLDEMKSWADASYAIHDDMKGHTGGTTSFRVGVIHTMCSKQKLNTKSSTESKLVGINDMMPMVLRVRYFLTAQGCHVKDNVLYQDNMSTMKLANNGKMSSGRRTRHLNIRYFFVADRISKGEMRIEHCPTEKMLADFYTKPLQVSFSDLQGSDFERSAYQDWIRQA